MNTLKAAQTDNRRIDQQHADLRRLVAEITRIFDRGGARQELQPRLAKLRTALAAHFAEEERAEGFYAQIAEIDPRFVQRIALLREEHAELLAQADQAVVAAETEQAREIFTRLRDVLERHEHDENNLLQAAYCTDIGSKD